MKRLVTEGAEVAAIPAEDSARDRVRERRLARKRKKTLRKVAIVAAICATVGGVYGVGFSYFSSHYYFGTQVAGVDASGLTEQELVVALDECIGSYEVTVGNGSFEHVLSGSKVGLSCDSKALAMRLMAHQDASSWPVDMWGSNAGFDWGGSVSFDQQKLDAQVNGAVALYNATAQRPVSATLKTNKGKDKFSLMPEAEGTLLDAPKVRAQAREAFASLHKDVRLGDADLVQPAFRASDEATEQALQRANEAFGLDVSLARGDKVVAHISGQSFGPWLLVNDDLTLAVDEAEAAEWAEEYVWQVADYADDKNVYSLDSASFGTSLAESINNGAKEPAELPYITTPRYLSGGGSLNPTAWDPDLGRYIDVDKKSQTACLYDETGRVLWETVVTTGNEAAGSGTPVGQFGIYDKKTDFMLIGFDYNNDGKPDYEHHVDFWMPFNEGIGLHDASWRKRYGGDRYLENGSGGCVNLPHDAAAALYAMTHVNEAVIVHE